MATETIDLVARADVKDFVEGLKKAKAETKRLADELDITESQAAKVQRRFARLDTDTRKATKSTFDMRKGMDALRKGAEAVQGPLGATASRALAAGEGIASMAAAAGPAGIAAAALASAILGGAGLVYALNMTVSAGQAASERLDELRAKGAAIERPFDGVGATLDDAANSSTNLSAEIDRLVEFLGEEAAPTLKFFTDNAAAGVGLVTDGLMALDDAIESSGLNRLPGWFESASAASTGHAEVVRALEQNQAQLNDAVREYAPALREAAKEAERLADAEERRGMDALLKQVRELAAEDKRRTAEKKREREEEQAYYDSLPQTFQTSNEVFLQGLDLRAQAIQAGLMLEEQAREQAHQAELERIALEAEARKQQSMLAVSQWAQGAKLIGDVAAFASERIQATQGENSKAAQAMFALQQGAALASVGFSTAEAIMKAFALFGPPPSPAGIAAATFAGVAGGVQAAAILSESPPQAHMGTLPLGQLGSSRPLDSDESLVRMRPGSEHIVTDQQMRGMGGDRIIVVPTYQHRQFDAFVADNHQRTDSPLGKAIRRRALVGQRER